MREPIEPVESTVIGSGCRVCAKIDEYLPDEFNTVVPAIDLVGCRDATTGRRNHAVCRINNAGVNSFSASFLKHYQQATKLRENSLNFNKGWWRVQVSRLKM